MKFTVNTEQSLINRLESIAKVTSRTEKTQLIKRFRDKHAFFTVMDIVMNPYRVYGLSNIPTPKKKALRPLADNVVIEKVVGFAKQFEKMTNRNEKLEILKDFFKHCTDQQRKWTTRILTKELRIGVQATTINKLFDEQIPTFDVQLAEPYSASKHASLVARGGYVLEPKLDGLRLVVLQGAARSRKGHPLWNVQHFVKQLQTIPELKGMVIDGELMAANWSDSVSIARSSVSAKDVGSLKYFIFDAISEEEFLGDAPTTTYAERRKLLRSVFKDQQQIDNLVLIPAVRVKTMQELDEVYAYYLSQGFEGVMLKRVKSLYTKTRGKDWLKLKPTVTEDLEIVGINEGCGRLEGTCGSITVERKKVLTNVSGISDKMRSYLWENKAEVIGMIAEVSYQVLSPDKKLLFPRFKQLREDK